MCKSKGHRSDVLQKIVELYKIESGSKKIAKELKIPENSTIRAIIRRSNQFL